MRFVGVSTGRAGSSYIATVMRQAGIDTLHEDCFNGDRLHDGRPVWGDRQAVGEWSAQAVPFLADLPDGVQVWHQVRHPLQTVGSLVRFGLFSEPERFGAQGRVIYDRFDADFDDPLRTSVRYYLEWNWRCEEFADLRWRVEDVTGRLLVGLGAEVDVDVDGQVAELVVDTTSRTVNGDGKSALSWTDLEGVPEVGELWSMAERYGYA